jgi:hypothetical protein
MVIFVVYVVLLFLFYKVYRILEYFVLKWWSKEPSKAEKYIKAAADHIALMEKIDDVSCNFGVDDYFEDAKSEFKKVRHHGLFKNYLVSCGRAKFGSPIRNNANLLVVRKFLYDVCKEHGVLPRHIQANLDFAVELVFMPSKDELLARAVRHTEIYQERIAVRDELGGLPAMP